MTKQAGRASRPPKYALHRPTGQARVRINGRDFYLGVFGSKESNERYQRLLATMCGPSPGDFSEPARYSITVIELVARYWEWASTYYVKNGRPSGHLPKVKQALRILRELYGSTLAAEFGPLAIRAVQNHCSGSQKSRVYTNDICGDIRRVFKWAASHELLPAAVYQALTTVPGLKRGRSNARETAPVAPVGNATLDATLPFLPPVIVDMVQFHRLVGCRPSELCTLRPGDLDRSGATWVYIPAEHKTEHHGYQRRIFIGPRAQEILRQYLDRPSSSFCFSPQDSEEQRKVEMRQRRQSKVQPSQINRRKSKPKRSPSDHYTKDSYNRAIHRATKKANQEQAKQLRAELGREPTAAELEAVLIKSWSPNQLRHAAATEIRRQFGIEAAQTVLGHSKADVTQVYAERDWRKAAEVMQQIG